MGRAVKQEGTQCLIAIADKSVKSHFEWNELDKQWNFNSSCTTDQMARIHKHLMSPNKAGQPLAVCHEMFEFKPTTG